MILGDPPAATQTAPGSSTVTIDDVFHRVVARRPGALALVDGPNRQKFTDGPPLRLTYAEADRMVTAIAGRLQRMGLPTDSVVGIQMPNIAENILTILGVMRAGMIAAPMPLLWRRADAVAALARAGAKALITCGRVGGFRHAHGATRIAAEVFSIRYVGGFGSSMPDGVVPFDDLFTAPKPDAVAPPDRERHHNAAQHVAIITFEVGEDGPVPVARNHLELLAGGLCVFFESRLAQDSTMLSAMAPSAFAGICLTLLPWLLSGGTLALHHPFDADVFARQRRNERCDTLVLPGPVGLRLAEADLFAREGPTTVLAAWCSPDRLAASADWHEREAVLIDVPVFGEAGLIAARRGPGGHPSPIPLGRVVAPRGSPSAVVVAELMRSETGTVALRGPMVPHHPFPPGVEQTELPHFGIERRGTVDTGYACRADPAATTMVVTGPPSGIVSVGGYRFALSGLLQEIGRIDSGATLAALPDAILGQRLVGNAADPGVMQAALTALGVNPLVAAAFGGREALDRRAAG